eukprot:CAMPEP_0119053324 /NCGR_PEP_ID=MMETSP1177-20130426/74358_1 /TAXON_ID=2985 /ORGANISM="Ochromonas sp, Strain CCMP1899" /LENGTH=786 /DNA_ID=CAMNT_0007033249 /DNA_START=876 /DNA_END=3237 /DNA_ORIENTATION=-
MENASDGAGFSFDSLYSECKTEIFKLLKALATEKIKGTVDSIEERGDVSYENKVIGRKKKEIIEEHSLGSGEHSGFKDLSTAMMDELSGLDSASSFYRELAIAILSVDEDKQALIDSKGFQRIVEDERSRIILHQNLNITPITVFRHALYPLNVLAPDSEFLIGCTCKAMTDVASISSIVYGYREQWNGVLEGLIPQKIAKEIDLFEYETEVENNYQDLNFHDLAIQNFGVDKVAEEEIFGLTVKEEIHWSHDNSDATLLTGDDYEEKKGSDDSYLKHINHVEARAESHATPSEKRRRSTPFRESLKLNEFSAVIALVNVFLNDTQEPQLNHYTRASNRSSLSDKHARESPGEYKKYVNAKNKELEIFKNNIKNEKSDPELDLLKMKNLVRKISVIGENHFLDVKLKEQKKFYWWKEDINENEIYSKNLEYEKILENLKKHKILKTEKSLKILSDEKNKNINYFDDGLTGDKNVEGDDDSVLGHTESNIEDDQSVIADDIQDDHKPLLQQLFQKVLRQKILAVKSVKVKSRVTLPSVADTKKQRPKTAFPDLTTNKHTYVSTDPTRSRPVSSKKLRNTRNFQNNNSEENMNNPCPENVNVHKGHANGERMNLASLIEKSKAHDFSTYFPPFGKMVAFPHKNGDLRNRSRPATSNANRTGGPHISETTANRTKSPILETDVNRSRGPYVYVTGDADRTRGPNMLDMDVNRPGGPNIFSRPGTADTNGSTMSYDKRVSYDSRAADQGAYLVPHPGERGGPSVDLNPEEHWGFLGNRLEVSPSVVRQKT